MVDNTRLWSTQLREDQDRAMKQIIDDEELSKSELMKQAVDTYLDDRQSSDLSPLEDAALDAAVVSSVGTIAVTAAAAFGLLPFGPGLQLAGVLAVTAVVAVLTVQQDLLGGER